PQRIDQLGGWWRGLVRVIGIQPADAKLDARRARVAILVELPVEHGSRARGERLARAVAVAADALGAVHAGRVVGGVRRARLRAERLRAERAGLAVVERAVAAELGQRDALVEVLVARVVARAIGRLG